MIVTDSVGDSNQFVQRANRGAADARNNKGSCDLVVDCEASQLVDRSSVVGNRSSSRARSNDTWVRLWSKG